MLAQALRIVLGPGWWPARISVGIESRVGSVLQAVRGFCPQSGTQKSPPILTLWSGTPYWRMPRLVGAGTFVVVLVCR